MLKSMSYGTLPDAAEIVRSCDDEPYPIRGLTASMIEAINQGIDAHLEAVQFTEWKGARTSSAWNHRGIDIEPESLPTFLRRLVELWEEGNEEAGDDVSCILETLGFEWI